eukprot:TRINITY_DN13898_c0_g2_i1.p1 TRINITY_DN13898_c0_g2~~TRINITY_DN13898_c0_g2_i1.p1  ORF type:complete len:362 (-),score=54.47 TRINITY_DN13898_c0_g2_i1:260-1345(-)
MVGSVRVHGPSQPCRTYCAAAALFLLSLNAASSVGYLGSSRAAMRVPGSAGRAGTSHSQAAASEREAAESLEVGDLVVLAPDWENFDDAPDGPLKPGDVGRLIGDIAEYYPKPLKVEFEGETWLYMLGALEKAPAAESQRLAEREKAVKDLLKECEATSRGQSGKSNKQALELIKAVEDLNPTARPSDRPELLEGTWRLIFASEDVTRSSPFFWGWRQLLAGVPDPLPLTRALFGTEQLSESIFAITDNIPIKTIGEAVQTLSDGVLVNRVELKILGVGQTFMTTTCRYTGISEDGASLALIVQTTQPSESSIPEADRLVFPSEALLGSSAQVTMRVTYLDDRLRISRNVDDQVFVYSRMQ